MNIKANNEKADCLTVTISVQTSRNKRLFYVIHSHIWGADMDVL